MMVTIGSARSDENGNISGGKAGDQKNGLEVSTEEWYLHPKGWVVLRPKNPEKAEKIAKCMQMACDNDMIGYNQDKNFEVYAESQKYDFDVSKIRIPVNADCSYLVRTCLAYAGIFVSWFSTANEVDVLMASKQFDVLDDVKYTASSQYLKKGDVLVTKSKGHTAIVLNDGSGIGTEEQKVVEPYVLYVKSAFVGMINADKVNVYVSASTKAERLKSWPVLGNTNLVNVLGQTMDSKWYYILIANEHSGWIESRFLVDSKTKKPSDVLQKIIKPASTTRYVAKVIPERLSVKTGPGPNYPDSPGYSLLGKDGLIDVFGMSKQKKWAFINIRGAKGWVPLDSIEKA